MTSIFHKITPENFIGMLVTRDHYGQLKQLSSVVEELFEATNNIETPLWDPPIESFGRSFITAGDCIIQDNTNMYMEPFCSKTVLYAQFLKVCCQDICRTDMELLFAYYLSYPNITYIHLTLLSQIMNNNPEQFKEFIVELYKKYYKQEVTIELEQETEQYYHHNTVIVISYKLDFSNKNSYDYYEHSCIYSNPRKLDFLNLKSAPLDLFRFFDKIGKVIELKYRIKEILCSTGVNYREYIARLALIDRFIKGSQGDKSFVILYMLHILNGSTRIPHPEFEEAKKVCDDVTHLEFGSQEAKNQMLTKEFINVVRILAELGLHELASDFLYRFFDTELGETPEVFIRNGFVQTLEDSRNANCVGFASQGEWVSIETRASKGRAPEDEWVSDLEL